MTASSSPIPASATAGTRTTVIRPMRGWVSLRLSELWEHRELLYFLVWRDVKVRYKQTALGASWAIIQPLFTMVVFSIFFGALARIPSDGVPYPVFAYAGLLPWQLFAHALIESGNSLVSNERLITKVYFPRLVIPTAAVLAGVVDLVIAFTVLLVLMAITGVVPTLAIVTLPLLVVLALVTAAGVGVWLSALNVRYRDVRYVIPFLTQLWLFATPVAYPASIVPEQWRPLLGLNPMTGVVEGFRWALIATPAPSMPMLAISAVASLGILVSGIYFFRRVESSFADVI